MSFIEKLLESNLYITEMLGACLVIIWPHRKKEHFLAKATLFILLIEVISAFVMNHNTAKSIWQNSTHIVISCSVFVVVFACISACFITLCCQTSLHEIIYCSALCLCIQHFSSSFQQLLFQLFPHPGLPYRLLIELITVPAVYYGFYRFSIKKIIENGYYQLRYTQLTLATCLIFLVAAITSITVKGVNLGNGGSLYKFCQIYEMLCCFFLMWIQVNQKETLALQHELDLQDYMRHLRYEQMQSNRQNVNLMTHLMHDITHQVSEILGQNDVVKRNNLISQVEENLNIYNGIYQTENETLNTALMEKTLYCRQNHIEIFCAADCEYLNKIESGDLYLILRNALDNAIDSVLRLDSLEKRVIDLKIFRDSHLLLLLFENPYNGIIHFKNGLPLTTKQEKAFHGYGLKTVQQIAEKYNGNISISTKNNKFALRILIPIQF